MKLILKIYNLFLIFFSKYYFNFTESFSYLESKPSNFFKNVYSSNLKIKNDQFEKLISDYFDGGYAINFASARMALFSILKSLNISKNDNICITAFTCSAVVNAVKRLELNIKYVDINSENFGTSFNDLEKKIDKNTKVILAQHTFGFACDITDIRELCNKKNIILIEDCALTFGSKYKKSKLGTYGDVSIFSFDQTKPFSTFIGGCVLTKNKKIYKDINEIKKKSEHLSKSMQKSICRRINYLKSFNKPIINAKFIFIDYFLNFLIRVGLLSNPYLDSDFGNSFDSRYPYPAKYPYFLSELGIIALSQYKKKSEIRKNNIKYYINRFANNPNIKIPEKYFNNLDDIETNRLIILHRKAIQIRKKIQPFVKSNLIWFKKPIEAGYDDLSNYGYTNNDCSNAEHISKEIINLPLDISRKEIAYLSKKFISICNDI